MPKDKVVETWSGAKYRYRKDGKLDRRFKYAKTHKVASKDIRRPEKKPARRPLIGRKWLLIAFVVYIAIVVLLSLNQKAEAQIYSPVLPPLEKSEETFIDHESICEEDYITREICKYDWDSNIMIAIAKSENGYEMHGGWKPDAINTANSDGTEDRGILMINSRTFEDFMRRHGSVIRNLGITEFDDMLDYEKNIMFASFVYAEQGLGAWACYWKENYKEYLHD